MSAKINYGKFNKLVARERSEHPWMSQHQAQKVVGDHYRFMSKHKKGR